MHAIDARNVHKTYGDVTALDGLSLTVDQGATFGLLGSNGAGKTTLFKLLVGLDRPDSGTLSVAGQSPSNGTAVRERVGYLPEQAGFPGSLTGREILRFHARMRDVPNPRCDRRVERVLRTVGLADAADRAVDGYSNGMNRRLGLGTMLVADPMVLLLDEPTAGLDPHGIDAFHDVISRITDGTNITVVFSSHALAEAEQLCDSVAVVDDGRVLRQGAVEDLMRETGDDVTIRLRYDSRKAAESDVESLRTIVPVTTTDVDRTTVELSCPRADAYTVLSAAHDCSDPVSFEVREPGLSRVFEEAIESGTDAEERQAMPDADEQAAADGGEAA